MNTKQQRFVRRWLLFAILVPITFVALFPYYWTVNASLKNKSEILQTPPTFIPLEVTLENYRVALFEKPFLKSLGNSVMVATAASVIGLLVSSLGAYVLARFRFNGRGFLTMFILFTQ